ncbi:putative glyoxylate reductase/hydroxypyruvate reductase-like [Scophthalmus maximus]|uniref:Glyoxylate reductase/hydroxypyruvate reductase n=1 Tax=Scophthalmus maximus TaxID=52904 RepID=A0A2U9CCQ8_SCOMX|nr:putative glyoxylate reductase/hydroxypyruvate reductase-like [Scophthalmus maximus]
MLTDIVKQHFQITYRTELLQDPKLHGPEIQAMFTRSCCPTVDSSLLSLLPSLKVVSNGGAGVDHLDVPFITGQGVKVTNTPGAVSGSAADVAMLLLLASARKIVESLKTAEVPTAAVLPERLRGVEVTGSTLGIIGMGEIGYKIAQRSKGFDMTILYHNRTRRSVEDERAVRGSYCERLDDLLRRSDFVVVAVKLTSRTTGLIGRRELSLMKPSATLVNISRGQVVDQDALVEALQSGGIRAAALDVTHPEPLPRDHPLLGLPNVLITPHIGTNTNNTARAMVERMVENALAAVKGLPVPNEVRSQSQ